LIILNGRTFIDLISKDGLEWKKLDMPLLYLATKMKLVEKIDSKTKDGTEPFFSPLASA
jgi:hypothetical protein